VGTRQAFLVQHPEADGLDVRGDIHPDRYDHYAETDNAFPERFSHVSLLCPDNFSLAHGQMLGERVQVF
jgi:hypothetical protein